MRARLAVVVMLIVAVTGCATAKPDPAAAKPEGGPWRATTFESWSACNGTGGFFCPVGPAGGTGVRWAWPQ